MGKKIQCIGRYVMEGQTLGKGNFARVELAHHTITGCKVGGSKTYSTKLNADISRELSNRCLSEVKFVSVSHMHLPPRSAE